MCGGMPQQSGSTHPPALLHTCHTGLLADLLTSQAHVSLRHWLRPFSCSVLFPDIHLAPSHTSFRSLLKYHRLQPRSLSLSLKEPRACLVHSTLLSAFHFFPPDLPNMVLICIIVSITYCQFLSTRRKESFPKCLRAGRNATLICQTNQFIFIHLFFVSNGCTDDNVKGYHVEKHSGV